jgi:protein-disulfide isomerase
MAYLNLGLRVLAIGAAAVLAGCGGDDAGPPPPRPEPTAVAEVEQIYDLIPQDGVRLGSADAPATLIEFADLQCPFCARFSREVLPTVVGAYVARRRLAIELRIRAFLGRDSVRAAGAAAVAARSDRLFQFADLFYREQGLENSGYVTNAFVRSIAERVPGVDADAAAAAADDPLGQPLVHRAQRLSERLGSKGSPDFFLRRGGRVVPVEPTGPSAQEFIRALDAALRRRAAAGTSP